MATIIIYNNDVQGALRALKKELQKEGVFRLAKARKNFKNNREKAKERIDEIIRRKIKDKHEEKANSAYIGVNEENPKPFVFKLDTYTVKVYNDGKVIVYSAKSKKINEMMLNEANFDNISDLVKQKISEKNTEKTKKKSSSKKTSNKEEKEGDN